MDANGREGMSRHVRFGWLHNLILFSLAVALAMSALAACSNGDDDTVRGATPTATADESPPANTLLETPTAPASSEPGSTVPADSATAPVEPSATTPPDASGGETPSEATPPQPPPGPGSGALALLEQGFSQTEGSDEIGWGFVVENRDLERACVESSYEVTVYDASGVPVEMHDGRLDTVMPGQRLGVGGALFLSPGVSAARVDVIVTAGTLVEPQLDAGLAADTVRYYNDDLYPTATGVIRNDFARPLEDIEVFAVAFDSAGLIVGGGSSFLSFVLPGEPTGVEVVVTAGSPPVTVELFPMVTSLTRYSDQLRADADPPDARPLFVDEQGFGALEAEHAGWGFVIQNPNEKLAAEEVEYHVTAWADDDSVLGTSASSLSLILPGERFGVGGELFLPAGPIIERITFQLLPRAYAAGDLPAGYLTVDDIELDSGAASGGLSVRGRLSNDLDQDLSMIDVYALAYDESGAIVGGGSTIVDIIEAGGAYRVTVPLIALGTPARVDMYAVPGDVSGLD
jgi:hypothetical protein